MMEWRASAHYTSLCYHTVLCDHLCCIVGAVIGVGTTVGLRLAASHPAQPGTVRSCIIDTACLHLINNEAAVQQRLYRHPHQQAVDS